MSKGKKLSVKAIVLIVTSVVAAVAVTLGLCLHFLVFHKKEGYFKYFNNFSTQKATTAEATLTLSENTYVYDYYQSEDVFITAKVYYYSGGENEELYGLASSKDEFCEPLYSSIAQIKGDYALVERKPLPTTDEDPSGTYWDLIRFRGAENAPYSVFGHTGLAYLGDSSISFVGDYLAVHGSLDELSSTAAYSTFYDYKSWNEPLEKFRIRKGYDAYAGLSYSYLQADDYLVAYTTDKAYFYNVNDEILSGYIENTAKSEYKAFPEIEDLSSYDRDLQIYYMGNGWFARSARIYSTSYFNGFNLLVVNEDTGEYSRTKTDFYNVKTGVTKNYSNIIFLANVANKYHTEYFGQEAHNLNNVPYMLTEGKHQEYSLPFANPANMVKDGYSIVYFYYMPYLEEFISDRTTFLGYAGETTYCIMDENLNITQPSNALMPTVYVDGVGHTTSDPYFTEFRSSAYIYDKDMKETVLAPYESNVASYIVYYANETAAIVSAVTQENGEKELYGAISPDGKRITDFEYDELTHFSGGYAVAYQTFGTVGKYYRISEKGERTEIEEKIQAVFQGIYLYEDGDKTGIKNYAGETLLEPTEGALLVMTEYLTAKGDAFNMYVAISSAGWTKIYEIK